ncbi:MAG: hypothetical protein Q4G50_04505 [Corynebacterium sp.]|uniref:hypothetical protein n=1 Tax=Corynebacterium sp. TaxID=1720 RepID=UPI0026E089FD|nr:hypothetical protein [Corynebacterium sp.]MDO5669241.1 hypothetical protein [Corynebacterium sp.]
MTTDEAWLKSRAFLLLIDAPVTIPDAVAQARSAGLAGVVLHPSHVQLAGDTAGLTVVSVVGYPSGCHHTLVKAAEARLAVAQGAEEIWLATDPAITDDNALLAEFVAVREAVPPPVTLAVFGDHAATARLAGVDRMVGASISGDLPHTILADSLDAVIAALEAGADRVAVSDVAAVCPPPG